MPAVTSKKMSLELRAEARAGTSMVLVLQLSLPCTWKSLVEDAGGPFPQCSVLPYKRAGPQAEARPPGAPPPCPSGGQAASGPRGPMLEATTVFWTIWVYGSHQSRTGNEAFLNGPLIPSLRSQGIVPPRLKAESGDQLCPCGTPSKVLVSFQLNFLTWAPALWLA